MTEVQVWVLMGLFATLGTVLVTLLLRTIDARFDGLHAEMSARFDNVDRRIDGLDRDVHMLVARAVDGGDAG